MQFFKLPPISPEMQLILALIHMNSDKNSSMKLYMENSGTLNAEIFFKLVDRHKVAPMVYHCLKAATPPDALKPIAHALEDRVGQNTRRMLVLSAELANIIHLLHENGISVLPLKGPALALQVYGDLAFRNAGDLDLLVSPQSFDLAEDLLLRQGYRRIGPKFGLTPWQMQIYRRRFHHFGYYHSKRNCHIELHWRMFSVAHFSLPDLDRTVKEKHIRIGGVPIRTLGPEDTLIYLCGHGSGHTWFRLFWLLDVAKLVKSGEICDWEHLVDKASRSGCLRSLAQGLVLAHVLLGSPLPDAVLRYAVTDKAVMGMVKKAILMILRPADGSNGSLTLSNTLQKIHRFAMVKDLHHKLQAFLVFFKPIPQDWHDVPLPQRLYPLYYLLRPVLWLKRNVRISRTQNPEPRTQNSELRTQNPEPRTQNSELRTHNS
jgi:hypothetical protein